MKRIGILFIFCFMVALLPTFLPQPVLAMTGSGTVGDPYIIYNVTDLQNMANNLSAYYELANDIDASGTHAWNGDPLNPGTYFGFVPIGTLSTPFTGCFDGNGYTISGLYINRQSSYVGMFGYTQNTGLANQYFTNVTLELFEIWGHTSATFIYQVKAPTNVSWKTNISYITVTDAYCHGLVYPNGYGGAYGFIGEYLATGTIEYCDYDGVTYGSNAAGWIGSLSVPVNIVGEGIKIYRCRAYVDVTGYRYYETTNKSSNVAGGFIHSTWADWGDYITIEECFAIGKAYGYNADANYGVAWASGFVDQAVNCAISNCFAIVDITLGPWNQFYYKPGGFCGLAQASTFTHCYSAGYVHRTDNAGGFLGTGGGCTACFWDTERSTSSTSACGNGRTTAEMKTQSTFTAGDWDFAIVWGIKPTINNGYPYLLWWYNPVWMVDDIYQVVWFQPNTIIEDVILPNRAQGGNLTDGKFTWGANPAGITISHGELIPEEEYDFQPLTPDSQDIIKPEPETMVGDVDLDRLHDNPFYPLVQILAVPGVLTERLVWLGLAWFIVIAAMFGVHLGFDTRPDTEKPQHFILTTVTGLGLCILFYTMGIFPVWVIILMAFGLVGAIIWERQPVI